MTCIQTSPDVEKNARLIIQKWFDLLKEGKVQEISDLYDENADFLPTFSPLFVHEHEGVEDYFKHFISKKPIGIIIEDSIRFLCCDCFLHEGMYDFEVGDVNNRQMIHARFTFIWQKTDDDSWKIVHHHSSVRP